MLINGFSKVNLAEPFFLSLRKQTVVHIFICFNAAMINDWSSRTPPDLLHFVPYTWKINFCLKEFELITPTNEYNWIDCSSQHHENCKNSQAYTDIVISISD